MKNIICFQEIDELSLEGWSSVGHYKSWTIISMNILINKLDAAFHGFIFCYPGVDPPGALVLQDEDVLASYGAIVQVDDLIGGDELKTIRNNLMLWGWF